MNQEIINEVKEFVKRECEKPTSNYGHEPFEFHFKPAVKYAKELSEKLDADKEIVVISTWLHDIGSIIHGRENHHETGAEVAEEKLKELDYPEKKIELVKGCIKNHRSSIDNPRSTLEEKIVAEADALSCFDDIPGLFQVAFKYEDKDRKEGIESVKRKIQNQWESLHFEESREIIRPKYEAAMEILD